MASEAVVSASAATAAAMIVLNFVMDVSSWAERGSPCDDPSLEAQATLQCDGGHSIGKSLDWYDRGSEISCAAVVR
jgi:hypothetical protein